MLGRNDKRRHCSAVRRLVAAIAVMILAVGSAMGQNPTLAPSQSALGTGVTPLDKFLGALSPSKTVGVRSWPEQLSDASKPFAVAVSSIKESADRPDRIPRRITLDQVKQQVAAMAASPLARLGQLSIEAAKLHRLGVQSDYFPKIGATVTNLHFTDFLGEVLTLRRPLAGATAQVPVPLLSQNQTVVALTFVQPITPLFQVYQAVKIARADERIAMAKAGRAIAQNISNTQIEETYFKLLIAQRRVISADRKLRIAETPTLYASVSRVVRAPAQEPELLGAKAAATAFAEVRELTDSLNRMMGWPSDTELDLVQPDPLVENISAADIGDKNVTANLEVIEAEQTVIKARAASTLSKLTYIPTVAATSGFIYQNALPLLPTTFGYGGLIISYNIYDFGKRERAVKEASAQREMAEIAVQLTKSKVAANMKAAYAELERTRQLSQITQKMGSSVTQLLTVSSTPENRDMIATRADVEVEMLEADLAHRKAYARLKALMDPPR